MSAPKKPNFLIILADDLGYSDVGCYGSEIHTPSIDSLAKDGCRFTNFHTAAACSPTRSMIMSGTDHHLAGVGCMIEYKQNERGLRRWAGKAGHEGYLNKEIAPLPEILQDAGYYTAIAGKWHLGLRPTHGPSARGFQDSFAILPGCCNHFGWEPVLETGFAGMPVGGRPLHVENGKRAEVKPNKTEDPEGFYSSDRYTEKLISYLENRSTEDRSKPFFGYLAFSAPHWPLQSPKAARDLYKDSYEEGPYALREKRLAKLVALGLVPQGTVPHEVIVPTVSEWDDMTEEQRKLSSRSMAAYAGMVHQIDVNVGRIIDHLKKTGEYDDTFIIFMSDNGAEGAALEAVPVMGQKVKEAIHMFYDNSLDNIGAYNSYTWLGPMWAQASTAPSRLMKAFPTEGGILVPCIVKAPRGSFDSKHQGGVINRVFSTCMDLAPTFMEMASTSLTDSSTDPTRVSHRGRDVLRMRGRSWIPFFTKGRHAEAALTVEERSSSGEEWAVYPSTNGVGWELHSRGAMRKGDWKIVHIEKMWGGAGEGDNGWELFNVASDPGETKDVSKEHPEKFEELQRDWDEYVVECGVIWGDQALMPGKSKEEAPDLHDSQFEQQRTWMGTPFGQTPKIV